MPKSVLMNQPGSDRDSKPYSCLTCRQRKVKCDRRTPCSNCAKAEKHCSFIPPVRGKRKRTKPPREGLRAKLKRYEELLKSYGANVEPSEDFDDSDSETASQPDAEMDEDTEPRSKSRTDPFGLEETKPKLITKEGTSRYFDSALWSNLGDEFQHPEVEGLGELIDESNANESGLFFEPEHNSRFENLASLRPSFQILPKLREIYVDRVDPLMKILHLPTFWAALINGLRHPQDLSKSLEAAIFAFCLATVSTLKEAECQNIFGVQKSGMYSRYRLATRQALVNAGFLSTSNPMTLRAYAMFMMGVRNSYRCDTQFILSGVAIRLARKMGLHRDGTSLGLSPFETEMRRRLWWHLVHMDFRTADLLGTRPSLDLSCGDTKLPLNVNDEDLHPDMVDPPPERNGITSIVLCLLRCEIIETLRKFSTTRPGDVRWEVLYSTDVTIAKKDSIISQIEDHLEAKYLRYCDLSNSLHTFVSIIIRSSICKMKLFAHNPRQFANSPVKVPQSERNIVFTNATKLLEYITLIQGGFHGLDKYMWQIGTSYLWRTMLYVLIEARHLKTGPEVDRSWQLIGVVFSQYPQVFEESTGIVYTALGMWTLEVWDDYVAASKAEGLPEPSTPEYINLIRRCRRPAIEALSKTKDLAADSGPVSRNSFGYNKIQSQICEGNLPDFEAFESYDFPNLLSFEMDPNEWVQWEQLVADEGGFGQVDSM
ncbi:putative C6 transcription factor [Glonium stellatum]|uniref:Putative C6 transcription factor n=1 Tax=Glonium stellatum TaxID=574774 RepID=A0A8E2FDG7_9PEZI|nr:putative C6 transcription factor [Glonium stellatum]